MTLISVEEAKTRLADCNVLLKYMSFLQNNGLSDCGRGQIMGQASLLQECLKEEEQQENKQLATDGSSQQQQQLKDRQQKEKQQQAITKDAEKTRTMIKATFHENAVDKTSKSDPLNQVGSVVDNKTKKTAIEENNEPAREGLNKQTHQILPKSMNEIITIGDDNNKSLQQIGGARTDNKETDQSWFNKIKKVTEVENWRSWQ
jgi:hypothetical protein